MIRGFAEEVFSGTSLIVESYRENQKKQQKGI